MKNHIFKFIFLALFILVAASTSHAGDWQTATKVAQYLIEGSAEGERIYVVFESNFNPDSCVDPGPTRIYGNSAKGKYLIASVMSAKVAAEAVIPLLQGCDCQSALKIDPPSASKIDPPQVAVFSS